MVVSMTISPFWITIKKESVDLNLEFEHYLLLAGIYFVTTGNFVGFTVF
jgi:hypothetical protein